MDLLREYVENGQNVKEYSRDGVTVSHTVRESINPEPFEPHPTIEEQILAENQYQTMILELTTLGGM